MRKRTSVMEAIKVSAIPSCVVVVVDRSLWSWESFSVNSHNSQVQYVCMEAVKVRSAYNRSDRGDIEV
jgi:hypothetical protein